MNGFFRAIVVRASAAAGTRLLDFARAASVRLGGGARRPPGAAGARRRRHGRHGAPPGLGGPRLRRDRPLDGAREDARDEVRDGVPLRRGRQRRAGICTDVMHALETGDVPRAEPGVPPAAAGAASLEGRLGVRVRARPRRHAAKGLPSAHFGERSTRIRRSTSSHIVRSASPGDRQESLSSCDSGVVPSTCERIRAAR